jgi:hypothetical protein
MDTEFINVFIQKQKACIEDLMSKNLILDAKLTMAEKVIAELTSKINEQTPDTKKIKSSPNT